MKKRILNVIFISLCILIFVFFYNINLKNYSKLKEIKYQLIEHPEFLPKKDLVKYTSFGFSNLKADIYWLETIQYIGGNVFSSRYKKYLYAIIDLITELNPYFEKPYLIGQLLLPAYNERYENLTKQQQLNYILQGEKIGLKGIKNFCDEKKIELIKNQPDLQKVWNEDIYKNPCKTMQIPFSQAFLYYFYLKDHKKSSIFYKITSANTDSLEGAKIMAAIMDGKSGDREKSVMMFLILADNYKKPNDKACEIFSSELKNISFSIFRQGLVPDGKLMKKIQDLREKYFEFSEEKEKELVIDNSCGNFINKAIRELNLYYLEINNKIYLKETGKNAKTALELFEKGYIDFLPTDFQQYKDYGIIYFFNEETSGFDYKMGNY